MKVRIHIFEKDGSTWIEEYDKVKEFRAITDKDIPYPIQIFQDSISEESNFSLDDGNRAAVIVFDNNDTILNIYNVTIENDEYNVQKII